MLEGKKKIALVLGSLPSVEEIDQFRLIVESFEVQVISSESICGYLTQNSYFQDLICIALKDHDENPTFLPSLEKVLENFDIVIVKERLGLYAYQAVKAKWRHQFKLIVWVDNLVPFPAHDVDQMRIIRSEVTNAADGFIVQTKAARQVLELEDVESSRIYDMIPWIESRIERSKTTKASARQTLGIDESDIVIAYLGQVEWEEGISDLVSAAKLMIMREPSLRKKLKIVCCGVGSYSNDLRDYFINLGVDNNALYYAPSRESIKAIQEACDAIYISPLASRDRIEGDPYRMISAMVQGIPIISTRHTISEEFCGKHRLDFCVSSPLSLARSIQKIRSAPVIVQDIVEKNQEEGKKRFTLERAQRSMMEIFEHFAFKSTSVDQSKLDKRVLEIEARVRNKQYIEAVDLIESVFRMDGVPLHHMANLYRLVGDCFAKLGDTEGAKDAYMHAVELDPYSAKVYVGLGTLGLLKSNYDIGVLHFQKAVSLSPDDEMANFGLGLAFQGMNEQKEAVRWVVKALQINPENQSALYTLVTIAYDGHYYEEAIQHILRYLNIHPNDYNFIYTLGGMKFKLGLYKECIHLMNQILEVDPNDKRAAELWKQAKSEFEQKAKAGSDNL